jgi:putative hydrolase of the HAD superfamily
LGVTTGPKALLVDYGGVLTSPPADSFRSWLSSDNVDGERFRDLMQTWYAADAPTNIVHDLETGRVTPEEFERQLTRQLVHADGSPVDAAGLLGRMFAGFRAEPAMVDVVRRAHAVGIKTALVSNSWGFTYPREGWAGLFDQVVISGEVGLRKPDPEIYRLTAGKLGLRPADCVFVDDLAVNVRGAAAVGMIGVHHTTAEETTAELEVLFDVTLTGPAPA